MSISGPSSAFDSETFGQDVSFHLDQPVGAMTISPSGRDVALASREGLHIIDLDSPYSTPRYLPHRTPWEVADVQWSPFAVRDYWVVSTSNQKALVWNLGAKLWQDTIEFVLHGHTRAITDINFSAFNPDILATCAVDSFVHCWDLRVPLRPAFSFSDWFAGATQVKWSRQDEHVVASSHDKFLRIWDNRNGAIPFRTIEAHDTKIYGIDWNRLETNKIVTCSLDRKIKFWDVGNPEDEPERVIETQFPVWRARHTPFGWGMMAMPQRGSGDLYLYDRREVDGYLESGHVSPVAQFSGHVGQVKEFLWRVRGTSVDGIDQRDFQLISWGTDKELRLHRLYPDALEGIGYEKGVSRTHRLRFTRKGARYKTYRDAPDEINSPVEPLSRGESFPSQGGLQFRKRASTNVGMSKVPAAQIRGWVAGNRRSARVAMHGRGQNHNDINPISWLRNVKIAAYDSDALAEEIRHLGDKFKKVEFETLDIKHRKMTMSLQAPWNEHQNAVYLRIDIRFPQSYPKGANAIITVQKTSAVEEDLHRTLSTELHTIAEVYASQQRGCLEAILRYLLREQSLEQIVTWVMGESVTDSKLLAADAVEGDESSDSDDDNLEGMGTAVASAVNMGVPLAKGCGALWSESGRLVCFFPLKKTESESILGPFSIQNLEGSDSSRLFEGFGRLHTSSPSRKGANSTAMIDEESDTDSSDSLLESSSSSSTSSEPTTELQGAALPYNKHIGHIRQHPHSIVPSNQSTTLAGIKNVEAPRETFISIYNYDDLLPTKKELAEKYKISGTSLEVCQHNARAARDAGCLDLSSIWTLASMILDRTVPLELSKEQINGSESDILVIAHRASSRLRRKDSDIGFSDAHLGKTAAPDSMSLVGQLRWGASPLAATYLITAMFDYYERTADVQILAMLSCVFTQPSSEGIVSAASTAMDSSSPADLKQYYPSAKVAKSLLQPDSDASGFVIVPRPRQAQMNRMLSSSDEQANYNRRSTFSIDPTAIDQKYETGRHTWSRTPSVSGEDMYLPLSRSGGVSLSTSPEGNRHFQRSSTSGVLSNAQASLSALTQSFSHSPPTQGNAATVASSLKKYSPSGSLTPGWGIFSGGHGTRSSKASVHYSESSSQDKEITLRSSASYSNARHARRDGRLTPDASRRSVFSSAAPSETSESTRRRSPTPVKRKAVRKTLRNQNKFDVEGHATLPLLDPALEWKYRSYRANYIQLLEVWQLYTQVAEVRKIDGISLDDNIGPGPTKRRRRKTLTSASATDNPGLQIRHCCHDCGDTLAAIEKNGVAIAWHCINTACATNPRKVSRKSSCSVCARVISGSSTPCLQCRHITCQHCASLWFEPENYSTNEEIRRERRSSSKSTILSATNVLSPVPHAIEIANSHLKSAPTCPTGCGCPCAALKFIKVPMPIVNEGNSTSTDRQPLQRTISQLSTTSEAPTMMSHTTTDVALNAFMALTRSTSMSQAAGVAAVKTNPIVDISPPKLSQESIAGVDHGIDEEDQLLNPWAGSKLTSLGRGVGGGLSRGLKEKGSDSTIRKGK